MWRVGREGSRGRAKRRTSRDAGYALTDALVATLILSLALAMGMRTLGQARDAADVAWEVRRAESLIDRLMASGPRTFAAREGVSDEFAWAMETTTTGAEHPVEVCRRAVRLENTRSGRVYAAATLETCPLEPPP